MYKHLLYYFLYYATRVPSVLAYGCAGLFITAESTVAHMPCNKPLKPCSSVHLQGYHTTLLLAIPRDFYCVAVKESKILALGNHINY